MTDSLPENRRVNDQVLIEMQFFDHAVPLSFAGQETMRR